MADQGEDDRCRIPANNAKTDPAPNTPGFVAVPEVIMIPGGRRPAGDVFYLRSTIADCRITIDPERMEPIEHRQLEMDNVEVLNLSVRLATGLARKSPEQSWLRRPKSRRSAKLIETEMKTLLLMRHAKASPSTAGVADTDRPLLDEGRQAASRVGSFLKREKLIAEVVLSSSALRALETVESVLQAMEMALEVRADQRIYDGGSLLLLEVLAEVEDDLKTTLLVGHNPVLEDLVQHLTGESVHLSPGTLAHVELNAEKWSEVHAARNKLRRVVRPNELD